MFWNRWLLRAVSFSTTVKRSDYLHCNNISKFANITLANATVCQRKKITSLYLFNILQINWTMCYYLYWTFVMQWLLHFRHTKLLLPFNTNWRIINCYYFPRNFNRIMVTPTNALPTQCHSLKLMKMIHLFSKRMNRTHLYGVLKIDHHLKFSLVKPWLLIYKNRRHNLWVR